MPVCVMNRMPRGGRWVALAILSSAVLLITMDMTVLYAALPSLTAQLCASPAEKLWIVNAYPLVVAGLLPGLGTLGDRLGHKRLFVVGLIIFGCASSVAAFAPTPELLILARVLLAIGAAAMMPATLSLIRLLFEDERERSFAIGLWAAVASGGAALGPVLGGLLLQRFWWGSVFLINLPVVATALILTGLIIPHRILRVARSWDLIGSLQILAGLTACIAAVQEMAKPKGSWLFTLAAFVAGISAFALFKRRQDRSVDKMIDFALFRDKHFTSGVAAALVSAFAMIGFELVLSQRLQLVLALTPLQSGFVVLPVPAAAFVSGPLAGALMARLSALTVMSAGLLVAGLGLAASFMTYDLPITWQMPGFVVLGLGLGAGMTAASGIIMSSAPAERAGMAASIEEVSFELGGAIGIAVLGSALSAVYTHALALPPALVRHAVVFASLDDALRVASSLPPEPAAALELAARAAFDQAVVVVIGVATNVMVLTAVSVGLLARRLSPAWHPLPHPVEP